MSHIFFANELEGVATWWSIKRRDGVALGFTSHDRDLVFANFTYRAAPGMIPSAIRRTAGLSSDAVEVEGVLAHDSISAADLEAGKYVGARIAIGLIDWETHDRATLFQGELGNISQEDGAFEAELRSAKASLDIDVVPRTSPTCRAEFCGTGCGISPARFTHLLRVESLDMETGSVSFIGAPADAAMHGGSVKWVDGPLAGITMQIIEAEGTLLYLDQSLSDGIAQGDLAILREGCDHTMSTCSSRFGNAVNFRGEPHLPGNDLLARYPVSSG
ncbi:hypothetical protein CP97_02870 [Aurantiacibacter atlanticus]|uniref:Bacteriophage phiJL001 Gp84 C-terminal domain-containing protein n=1 Tax=Aurantiacibacter atlanticus TaxID=1648404 RepID=A0A0H4VEG4_9SPHN|nr:DUF2163 domain-containing protein [Aurantiacibacter atlanticus]AKQ41211.1 hypothetical protein CP97_02870 [Aurantiacibacter atlanticus]MDF1835209.1 DUF2163 domain-containing protein [Alteraurantiacibacter sp. bin_em_oilr2.035]